MADETQIEGNLLDHQGNPIKGLAEQPQAKTTPVEGHAFPIALPASPAATEESAAPQTAPVASERRPGTPLEWAGHLLGTAARPLQPFIHRLRPPARPTPPPETGKQ